MADYTYELPQTSTSLTPHGLRPSTDVSGSKLEAQQAARRRGENVVTPVPTGYSVVPAPQQGQGRYGLVPGPIGLPDPHGNLAGVYPGLDAQDKAASDAIMSRLEGELSPETISNIENIGATFGVTSGMPGSGLSHNLTARDIGMTTEQLQQQGLADFSSVLPMIASTQTVSPQLQSQISEINAINAAMPNPRDASKYAKKLYDEYMKSLTDPGGGSGMFGMDSGTSSDIGQYAQLAGQVIGLVGMACWVAREVYGVNNPKWIEFRGWLLNRAPVWFRKLYLRFGERFARFISDKPKLKAFIRRWMDSRIS